MEPTIPADPQLAEPAVERRGRFLVLEGIDGCGKTTQIEALKAWLPCSGLMAPGAQVIVTREPGGTALGAALRQLLLHPPGEAAPEPMAELLLYAADRAQHVEQLVRPALAAGNWVLSDRFSGSTAAYQGYGRGLDLGRIAQLEQLAAGGLAPDLTLWLELSLVDSLHRRGGRATDRIEASGDAFMQRVVEGFATLARERSWERVDASQAPELVTAACLTLLKASL
ncbi:MAG: dTMP kinase [Cyanobium sp.]